MRPGEGNQEIVFEGAFEARVAAQLLLDARKHHLIRNIEPQIPAAEMTRREFRRDYDQVLSGGITDNTQYYCHHPDSLEVLDVLMGRSKVCAPDQVARNMREFMGQSLIGYARKIREINESGRDGE